MVLCFRFPSKIKWENQIFLFVMKIKSYHLQPLSDLTGIKLAFRSGKLRKGSITRVLVWGHTSGQATSKAAPFLCPYRMSHTGKVKRGRPSQKLGKHGTEPLCSMSVNLVLFMRTTFFVLEFKWHFESWPIWIILAPHPDPPRDSWIHLGLCLDSCNDVFQTQCLAAHFNDRQGLIGQFGTCQVLNAGMKVLMATEREIDLSWTWQQCHHAKLCQPDAWTFPDLRLF